MNCNDAGVLSAHLVIPERGPWTAEVVIDSNETPSRSVTLSEDGGVSLIGVVARGGLNPALLRWEGVIVGGAGGLATQVIGAYRNAQLGDVLDAIARQSGETLSGDIAASLRAVYLEAWTLGRTSARAALDALSGAAAASLGSAVTWRTLGDGSIWMGVESWPSESLPTTDEIVEYTPMLSRTVIGAQVVSLLPGVDLEGVGRVVCAEHWVEPRTTRTWAWT